LLTSAIQYLLETERAEKRKKLADPKSASEHAQYAAAVSGIPVVLGHVFVQLRQQQKLGDHEREGHQNHQQRHENACVLRNTSNESYDL